jgi:L-asparagine transporter-like permease
MKIRFLIGLFLIVISSILNYYYPANVFIYIMFLAGGGLFASNILFLFVKKKTKK